MNGTGKVALLLLAGAVGACSDSLETTGGPTPGTVCGNGTMETGEECEAPFDECCDSATCTFASAGMECRANAGECDVAESCTGSAASCPVDGFVSDGVACSGGTCEAGECTGVTPPPSGTICGQNGCETGENCESCPLDCWQDCRDADTGTIYYCSPSGSTSATGSENDPFRHLQQAADVVNPGDVVVAKDGSYIDDDNDNWVVRINRGGASGRWITFVAENRHGAVIDGENHGAGYGIEIDVPYIRIVGFEITDLNSHGAFLKQGAHAVEFIDNTWHHIGNVSDDSASGHCGLYTSPYLYDVKVDRNVMHDIGRTNTGCDHCGRHDQGLYLQGREFVVTNNIFYNFQSGWGISMRGHYGDAGSTPTHVVANNAFAHDYNPDPDNEGHINLYVGSGLNPTKDVIIANNVFYDPNGTHTMSVGSGTDAGDVYFHNNVSSNSGYASIPGTSSINLIESDNVMGLALSSFGLADPGSNDFTLTSAASHLIDEGRAADAPPMDYAGAARPDQSGLCDIGAYERHAR